MKPDPFYSDLPREDMGVDYEYQPNGNTLLGCLIGAAFWAAVIGVTFYLWR